MRRDVKGIQPDLVYVIEWRMGPNAGGAASASSSISQDDGAGPSLASTPSAATASEATAESSGVSSREARKAQRDRMKDAKERGGQERRRRRHVSRCCTRTGRRLARYVRPVPRLGKLLQHTQLDGPTPRCSKRRGETTAGRNGP